MTSITNYDVRVNDTSILIDCANSIPREMFDQFEYPLFSDTQLRNDFIASTSVFVSHESNVIISVTAGSKLKAFTLMEYLQFDSEIFGFNVYRITKIYIGGKDASENSLLLGLLLSEITKQVRNKHIKYLVTAINSNNSNQATLLNFLLGNRFRFINTLISFKMTKDEYKGVYLYQPKTKDIFVRKATYQDSEAIVNLAAKSYKINRYHLDPALDRDACDRLHATSVYNALMNGFADMVIVAEYQGNVVGYYTAKKKYYPELEVVFGHGLLTAVDESVRGLGIYSQMNNNILKWYSEHTDIAEMGTYVNNIPIHKTFTNNGLSIIRCVHQLSFKPLQ